MMGTPSLGEGQSGAPLRAVVVGGGPAGCVTAFFLAKRGFQVDVFERRSGIPRPHESADVTKDEVRATVFDRSETRSYAMMLTKRAFVALDAAGIELPEWIAQRIRGSRLALKNGKFVQREYGATTDNRTVARQTLAAWLLHHLQDSFPGKARVHLGYAFAGFKEGGRVALFEKVRTPSPPGTGDDADVREAAELLEAPFDLLVGADGVSSSVRTQLLKKEEAEGAPEGECELTCSQTTSPTLYKTLVVPRSVALRHGFEGPKREYLNAWKCGIMVVPMGDGSLWGGTMAPRLVDANSPETVTSILSKEAPALLPLLQDANPGFAQQFVEQPAIPQGTTTVLSRFHSGHVVLVGDAAHSMVPELGQGCNTAIEDCLVLDESLDAYGVRGDASPDAIPRALKEFTGRRLPDARAIQALNARRFFPRTFLDGIKFAGILTLSKVAPPLIGTPSFFMLFSTAPFRRILAQKEREDRTWMGLQASVIVAGLGIAAYACSAFLPVWK